MMQDVKNRLTKEEHNDIEAFFMDLLLSITMGYEMPIKDLEGSILQAKTQSSKGYKTFSPKLQKYIDYAYLIPLKMALEDALKNQKKLNE